VLLGAALLASPAWSGSNRASSSDGSTAGRGLPETFQQVASGIFRSAQPTPEALRIAKARGIRTLLVLRTEVPESERDAAAGLGLDVVHVPMSGESLPSLEQVDRALEAIVDPARRPVLVHCAHGEERTGAVVAAYRVVVEGWTPDAAEREARSLGFGFDGLAGFLARYREHRSAR
jgi:protein tyrosine/serine phosphatase